MTDAGQRRPIPVEPLPEARWDRIERRLMDARERERLSERGSRKRPRWPAVSLVATGVVLVGATTTLLFFRQRLAAPVVLRAQAKPTRVSTPPGAGTRLEVGDAVLLVGADTRAVIDQTVAGGVRVALEAGSVDCEVAPRGERPPFEVTAADVTVTVIGTRFQVEWRGDPVKVTVTHGQVGVRSPRGEWRVAAGETWTSTEGMSVPPVAAVGPSAASTPTTRPVAKKVPLSEARLREKTLKELHAGNYEAALHAAEEYLTHYPNAKDAEHVFRVRVLSCYGISHDARARQAAREYMQRFPGTEFAEQARRIANW